MINRLLYSKLSVLLRSCIQISVLLLFAGPVWAVCSGFEGQITINEVFKKNPNSDKADVFIELKVINVSLSPSDYANWTLQSCSEKLGCTGPILVSSMEATSDTSPWLFADNDLITNSNHIDINNDGMDIILKDSDGATVDYLSVGGSNAQQDAACDINDLALDSTASVSNSKTIRRVPDGTGKWEGAPGNSDKPTKGGTNVPGATGPNHIRLVYPDNPLTCAPAEIRVTACADNDCTTRFTDLVSVSFTGPGNGWTPSFVNLNDGTNGSSTIVNLRSNTTNEITLATQTSPASAQANRCFNASGTVESCTLAFAESGFLVDVPNHVSATTVQGTLTAVRKSDDSQDCVAGFAGETKTVNFWSSYSDPATGNRAVNVADSDNLENRDIPVAFPGTGVSLIFDGNGVAPFDLTYPDAGRVLLNARYDGPVGAEDEGLVMTGSGLFIARPAGFELSVLNNPKAINAADPDTVFIAAGADFQVTARALNVKGAVTPNFGQEDTPETVQLTSQLVLPDPDNASARNPAVGETRGFVFGEDNCEGEAKAAGQGTACGQFNWPEVGIIQLLPSLSDADGDGYLGGNAGGVSGPLSSNVGRFIPDRFGVTWDAGVLKEYCGVLQPFVYTGQAIAWLVEPQITITALATGDSPRRTTENYTLAGTGLQKLVPEDVERIAPTADGTHRNSDGNLAPITPDLRTGTLDSGAPGVLKYDFAMKDGFTYDKVAASVDGPFAPDIRIKLDAITDSDEVKADASDLAVSTNPLIPTADFLVRYGRFVLDNVYGPENIDELRMPFYTQFYDGARFVRNEDDNCTDWTTADITPETPDYYTLTLESPPAPDTGTLTKGADNPLILDPTGTAGEDTLTWQQPVWLRHFWNDAATLQDPSALATFGVYRGSDRIIYWQEVLD